MNIFNARGIVIKEIQVGEADKILILLLKDYGKLTVSVKDARRAKSPLMAATSLFCYSDFVINMGRKNYFLSQADSIKTFYSLRNNLYDLAYASYFLELINKTIYENIPCNNILLLLLKALNALSKQTIPSSLIVRIFEIKFLQLNGYSPHIDGCIHCGITNSEKYYFINEGIICEKCLNKNPINSVLADKTSIYTIKYILSSEIKNLFNFKIEDNSAIKLKKASEFFIKHHFDLNLKTYDFIKTLEFDI